MSETTKLDELAKRLRHATDRLPPDATRTDRAPTFPVCPLCYYPSPSHAPGCAGGLLP